MLSEVQWHFSKIRIFLGHFRQGQNPAILRIPQLSQYYDCQSRTKRASTLVEVSIESSEFRAFEGDLTEGASFFRFQMRVEILTKL